MILKFLTNIFGSRNDRLLKKYNIILKHVNNYEVIYSKLSNLSLKKINSDLKFKVKYESLDKILPEAFALVREISNRVLGLRHYDVQILAGIALYNKKVVEVATGEGKTLIATLPIYLNSLLGNSIHVVTVNDYLAKRDADWMRPIYEFLGLSVSFITNSMSVNNRIKSYKSNIVYGTNNEFCFDYLRDNLIYFKENKVQKRLYYAIIDEVDSILIDEARTPLIISSMSDISYGFLKKIRGLIFDLKINIDYIVDEENIQVYFTDLGFEKLEKLLVSYKLLNKSDNLYNPKNISLLHDIFAALKAEKLFKKDVDYIVENNKVSIVDEHTGRVMLSRRWSDGIHQAIEVKEHVSVQSESQTLATITFQNYFRLYENLSGMTGTAFTEASEFQDIYGLEVVIIPTNKPNIRIDNSDIIYMNKFKKFQAIVLDIIDCYKKKQPVLVGTASIDVSEYISKILNKLKVKHNVLNAKHHEFESKIISEAGNLSSVTIATNMAGRGTDIILGNIDNSYNDIIKLGGLKVIGTERHESRRIDNQLRGRSGRQGDPGVTQFYLSLEDDLVRIFVSDSVASILNKLNLNNDEKIMHPLINRAIENAQNRVECNNFDIRKQLLEYDDVINEQRNVIYERRNSFIIFEDLSIITIKMINDVINKFVDNFFLKNDFDILKFLGVFNLEFGFKIDVVFNCESINAFKNILIDCCILSYKKKKSNLNFKIVSNFEKFIFLSVLDLKWKEHLSNLDYLKNSIYLRGYAQKDPKQEYKKEAFSMFSNMLEGIKFEFIVLISKIKFNFVNDNHDEDSFINDTSQKKLNNTNELSKNNKSISFIRNRRKIGRNDKCYCGSKKKYKYCHGV